MKNLVLLAFKNIYSFRKKSFSAILSIASGFLALNLFQSYIYDVTLVFASTYSERNMYGDALIRYQKRHTTINPTEQKVINDFILAKKEQLPVTSKHLYFSGSANNGKQQFYFLGLGYELDKGETLRGRHWRDNTLYGESLNSLRSYTEINVGEGFSKSIGCKPEVNVTIPIEKNGYRHKAPSFLCDFNSLQLSASTSSGQVNAIESKVVGIVDGLFKELDDRYIVSSLEFAQRLTNSKDISYYSLKLADIDDLDSISNDFKKLNLNSELELKTWKKFDIGDFYQQSLSFLNLFKYFFSVIVISISTLSVMATFYRLINERKKEIGIYRSIGFKNNYIFKLFIIESFILSTAGVLVGLLGSVLIAGVFNIIAIPYALGMLTQPVAFAMTLNFKIVTFSSAVMIISSMIFGYYPVHKAMKSKITDILADT